MKALLTLGQVRQRLADDGLDLPLHRVKYAIDASGIAPTARLGILRAWSEATLPKIRAAAQRIANRGN